jgi:hypothetical protein
MRDAASGKAEGGSESGWDGVHSSLELGLSEQSAAGAALAAHNSGSGRDYSPVDCQGHEVSQGLLASPVEV